MHPAWRKIDALYVLPCFAYFLVLLFSGHPSHSIAARFSSKQKPGRDFISRRASRLSASFALVSLSLRDGEEQERKQSV